LDTEQKDQINNVPSPNATPSDDQDFASQIKSAWGSAQNPVNETPEDEDYSSQIKSAWGSSVIPQEAAQKEAALHPKAKRWATPTTVAQSDAPTTQAKSAPKPSVTPPSTFSKEGLEDVGKTVGSQLALGLAADIPGAIGSAKQLYDTAAQGVKKYGTEAGEFMGWLPKGSTQAAIELAKKQAALRPASEASGDSASIFGVQVPTAQGMEKAVRTAIPQLGYTPQTRAAKIIGAGARALPLGLLTGGEGLIAKLGAAAASGVASEVAGEAAEGTDFEPAARIAGALAGPGVFSAARNATLLFHNGDSPKIQNLLLQAISKDIANGSSKMNPEQIKRAIAQGANPGLWNMAGVETRKLISKLGYKTPKAQDALETLNNKIAAQQGISNDAVNNHISSVFGLDQGAADMKQAIADAHKQEVSNLYSALENDPNAQAVYSPGLSSLQNSNIISSAGKRAASLATSDPQIVPPRNFGQNLHSPGNIFYWDQIKRDIDDQISVAIRGGENNQARVLTNLKTKLVNELDNAVPAYAEARDAASESLGAQNAVEAGYNALKGGVDNLKASKMLNIFNKYNNDRKDLFQKGIGNFLSEKAQSGGSDQILNILRDPNKGNLIRSAIGDDAFNSILGRTQSESIMKRAKAFGAVSGNPDVEHQVLNAELMLQSAPAMGAAITGNIGPLAKLIGTKTLIGSFDYFKNATLKKRAGQILNLIGTDDPQKLTELGARIRAMPEATSFLGNLMNTMRNNAIRYQIGSPTSQDETAPDQQPSEKITDLSDVKRRVASAESAGSGGYNAIGPAKSNGDRPFGKYQVMASNIPQWTGQYVGREMTPEEFLRNPEAQERVFEGAFGDALKKYGNEKDAISWWHSGHPLAEAQNRKDVLGTTTPQYVAKVTGHASGGRIERASGGKVDSDLHEKLVNRLMNMAKQAKKVSDKTTEPLLNVPDEAIVKALGVAQEAI
jgi:uncharacterized protein YidB (DUF937 family)